MSTFDLEHSRKIRVAWLYHVEGLTQDGIAQRLGITRVRVQRLLAQAREEGIVRVTISDPISETIVLAAQLKDIFGLREAIVTPTPDDAAHVRTYIGHAAAEYLRSILREGMSLGVGWGTTLVETARALGPSPLPGSRVVALMGGLTRSSALNPHEIAWQLAQNLQGECYYLAAPTYADSLAAREAIIGQPSIREVLQRGRAVDVALVSVGTLDTASTMRRSGLLSDEDVRALEEAGTVGDILGRQFDAQGLLVASEVNERVISISPDSLRQIETVILMSGGLEKVRAIRGALRARYADVLVIDEAAAATLVAAEQEAKIGDGRESLSIEDGVYTRAGG